VWVYRFAFESEDTEDAIVDAPQRLLRDVFVGDGQRVVILLTCAQVGFSGKRLIGCWG
jgi:hypothetical protein